MADIDALVADLRRESAIFIQQAFAHAKNGFEAEMDDATGELLARAADALEAERSARVRLEEALRNLAHEMRFLLRTNPQKDGGLYRQRLTEAESALGVCHHNCDEGGICLAQLSGFPESCPRSLSHSSSKGESRE